MAICISFSKQACLCILLILWSFRAGVLYYCYCLYIQVFTPKVSNIFFVFCTYRTNQVPVLDFQSFPLIFPLVKYFLLGLPYPSTYCVYEKNILLISIFIKTKSKECFHLSLMLLYSKESFHLAIFTTNLINWMFSFSSFKTHMTCFIYLYKKK